MKTESLPAGRGPLDRRDPKRYNPLSSLLTRFRKGGKTGSAIVGVLAALVFIGIVVAAMVKNTGSQSAASIGYGTELLMSSTAQSGVVATEAFMQRVYSTNSPAINAIQDYLDFKTGKSSDANKRHPCVFGDNSRKRRLADRQFFRSRLIEFDDSRMSATFEVESGKNERGKTLKKVSAFYAVDGLEITGGKFPGTSTLFLGGNMQGGNRSVTVKGYATFMDDFTTNETAGVVFEPDEKQDKDGNVISSVGDVFFNGAVSIDDKIVEFKVPVFFKDDAVISKYTNDVVFHKGVGFNKNFSTRTNEKYLGVKGIMWIKNGIKKRSYINGAASVPAAYDDHGIKIKGQEDGSKLFYTDSILALNMDESYSGSDCAKSGVSEQDMWKCFSFQASLNNIDYTENDNKKSFETFNTSYFLRQLGMDKEAGVIEKGGTLLDAATLRKNSEPTLGLARIINETSGKVLADPFPLGGGTINLATIEEWFTTKYTDPKYYNEGHLLVRINGDVGFEGAVGQSINRKIAFILGENSSLSGTYFNSGANASTLFYAGGTNGQLNLIFQSNFKGLIYVDENNICGVGANYSRQHTFTWGPDCQIDGAVLLKGNGRINWNTSVGGPAVFTRNNDILKAFTNFITSEIPGGGSDTEKKVSYKDGATGITLTPLGYYNPR